MRPYRLHQEPLAKTLRYPLRRCSLDAALAVAEVDVVQVVHFHNLPGHPVLDAILQGKGRRNAHAGSCELTVNAVPVRHAKAVERLVLIEALPRFFAWLKTAVLSSEQHPTDVFRWSAELTRGALSYRQYPNAP